MVPQYPAAGRVGGLSAERVILRLGAIRSRAQPAGSRVPPRLLPRGLRPAAREAQDSPVLAVGARAQVAYCHVMLDVHLSILHSRTAPGRPSFRGPPPRGGRRYGPGHSPSGWGEGAATGRLPRIPRLP